MYTPPGVRPCMATDTVEVGFCPPGVSPNEVPTQAASPTLTHPHELPEGIVITTSCAGTPGATSPGKPVA